MLMTVPPTLSDDDLIVRIASFAGVERTATASLIAHLAELEARNLHLAHGFRSLFGYCRHVLHCSEHEAYNRMEAVHVARRFPVILAMLAEGLLHLTAVRLLAPHLRNEDHLALLGGAIHGSRREIVALLARWFPSSDVASSIRKLPTGAAHRPVVAPLSPRRYRVEFTIGEEAEEALRRLQDLLRGEIPNGDLGAIFVRGITLQLQEAEKKKVAVTSKPRPGRGTKPGSRHVPADVQRKVWRRDGGQCAFISKNGRRCTERSYIEYHHAEPYAFGGEATVANIALRCRSHNLYESELIFGPYDPSRVRETPAVYGSSAGPLTGSGTGKRVGLTGQAP